MTTLQASLLFKPLPPLLHFSSSKHVRSLSFSNALSCRRLSTTASAPFKTRFCRHNLLLHCTLNPEQVDSSSEFALSNNDDNSIREMEPIEFNEPSVVQIGSVQNSSIDSNAGVVSSSSLSDNEAASEVLVENDELKKKLPILVFLMGVFAKVKKGFENILLSDWFSWWPFWHQEKRLERLIADADANPNDAAMQSALLAELNKHSPESVIRRFEQRAHAVDSRGVAEYMRALVATNAIAEYLPDEQSGKPSSLPSLLQELKQRASGNMDEPFLNPGISEKQPLHVVMVDPKVSNRSSRFAQEFLSTIIFTIAIGLIWIMGATALQKYIGGLGGIGASGVGSSSSYAPKELNKEIMPEKNVKTFKDVKGCDDAKQELEEVVEYLKNPSKFTRLGGKLPKGILLTGAPGTGKTLLAKAIAGEAGVPFFYKAGSEFEEMFVGVGARRVRSLFQAAKKKAPCIIFIDEIDAVGSTRKQWEGHTKKTLHQLLVEMDGFEQNEGIILMAATNLPDILDPALTRPGRFDRHIVVPNPDVRGRQEILELYLQDKPVSDDVNVNAIARGTPGFNGADLANLVNIAAIKAAVEGAEKLNASQLEFAKDRIIMGTERKTMFLSEDSKKLTAYHESGHAIVALNTEGAHPIHKATIMPRGSALGMVTQLPSNDETSISKKQLLARLDVCMGGRVAEELVFGPDNVTTGASSDLHTATELAQYMVSSCGMSDAISNAYGIAEVGVMMVSTTLVTVVMLLIWQTNLFLALLFPLIFGTIELIYMSAVLSKIFEGGWLPLVFASWFLCVMYIWNYGSVLKYQSEVKQKISMDFMHELGSSLGTVRVPGIGLLYNELVQGIPSIFAQFLLDLPAIHSVIVFVCIKYVPVPVVPQEERFLFRRVGPKDYHMFRCVARYGYKDVRKEDHHAFEQLLVDSLEKFLRKEALDVALEINLNQPDLDSISVRSRDESEIQDGGGDGIDELKIPLMRDQRLDTSGASTSEASLTLPASVMPVDEDPSLEYELSVSEKPQNLDLHTCLDTGT